MIPERSEKAKVAKSVFFQEINDIDIYIEDTAFGYEKLFQLLFSRVFEGTYKVNKVFPLGGRGVVTDQHELHDNRGRPSLFVVDSDLFLLTGDTVKNESGLFKVPFYCIENILCDPHAIHDLLDEEEPSNLKSHIIKSYDYHSWLNHNEDKLFSLFIEYAITFIVNPTEQTVAFSVSNLVSSNNGNIDSNKLLVRIGSLKTSSIQAVGSDEYEIVRDRILTAFARSGVSKLDVVSGKDYLFPLLKTRAKSIVKTKAPDINLKIRLAMKCDISKLMESTELVAC